MENSFQRVVRGCDINRVRISFNRFLEASVAGLLDTQPPSVRISAVRAVFGFCEQLKVSESTSILLPFLEPILIGLVQLATQYGQDILALVLETIGVVLTVSLHTLFIFFPSVDKDYLSKNSSHILLYFGSSFTLRF